MKPLMSLDEVAFDDVEDNRLYTSRRGFIGMRIDARQLGYRLTALPPGKAQCPFHNHRAEEETFRILDGEGERRLPLRRHDLIACPTGGPEVAHQIVNTGATELRYLALSTLAAVVVCEYPDSGKVSLYVEGVGAPAMRKVFRAEATVGYCDHKPGAATEATP